MSYDIETKPSAFKFNTCASSKFSNRCNSGVARVLGIKDLGKHESSTTFHNYDSFLCPGTSSFARASDRVGLGLVTPLLCNLNSNSNFDNL